MQSTTTECPCKDETAEKLVASPEPDRVVTLVHGTFAEHAPWMREGRLWRALAPKPDDGSGNNPDEPPLPPEKCLPGTTLFSRFCWTGGNSHTDRLEAGEALKERLHGVTKKFPNARHFVIGHSHGGNVMLYAMKDKSLADRVTGLVTLATPFITVRRRKLHPLVRFGIWIISLLGILEAGLHFWGPDAGKHPGGLWIAVLILLWLFATVLSALKYRGSEFGTRDLFRLLSPRKNAEDIVTGELGRLKLTPDDESARKKQFEKMLVARPIGDEAAMSLVVSQFLSWVQNRILTLLSSGVINFFKVGWFSWIWKLVVVIVLAYYALSLLPNTMGEWILLPVETWAKELFGGDAYVKSGVTSTVVVGVLAIPVLYGLMCLIGLLVLLVAGIAFGPDAMFWNHYFSTTAESSPSGTARVFLQSPPPGTGSPGLVHSGIYTDAKVIDEIVGWINSREAAHAKT